MAQITRVTSEALQATIRRLLPSQQGFGEDLEASNVITPVIDLTPVAEGSILRADLQTAFNHSTPVIVCGTGVTSLTTTPGFYLLYAAIKSTGSTSSNLSVTFRIDDGSTTNNVMKVQVFGSQSFNQTFPVVFVNSGEELEVNCESGVTAEVTVRQIADLNGNLVNPAGFTFE